MKDRKTIIWILAAVLLGFAGSGFSAKSETKNNEDEVAQNEKKCEVKKCNTKDSTVCAKKEEGKFTAKKLSPWYYFEGVQFFGTQQKPFELTSEAVTQKKSQKTLVKKSKQKITKGKMAAKQCFITIEHARGDFSFVTDIKLHQPKEGFTIQDFDEMLKKLSQVQNNHAYFPYFLQSIGSQRELTIKFNLGRPPMSIAAKRVAKKKSLKQISQRAVYPGATVKVTDQRNRLAKKRITGWVPVDYSAQVAANPKDRTIRSAMVAQVNCPTQAARTRTCPSDGCPNWNNSPVAKTNPYYRPSTPVQRSGFVNDLNRRVWSSPAAHQAALKNSRPMPMNPTLLKTIEQLKREKGVLHQECRKLAAEKEQADKMHAHQLEMVRKTVEVYEQKHLIQTEKELMEIRQQFSEKMMAMKMEMEMLRLKQRYTEEMLELRVENEVLKSMLKKKKSRAKREEKNKRVSFGVPVPGTWKCFRRVDVPKVIVPEDETVIIEEKKTANQANKF